METWQRFCCFIAATHRVSVKCAKMERPVQTDRHFAFREAQKADRLAAFRSDSACRMTSQIERVIADFNCAINDLNRAIELIQPGRLDSTLDWGRT
jgi:hypothetical protein